MTPLMEIVQHIESFELSMKHNTLPANITLANAVQYCTLECTRLCHASVGMQQKTWKGEREEGA